MTDKVEVWEVNLDISTHTPLAGRDVSVTDLSSSVTPFLLTRPLRDVTFSDLNLDFFQAISTHTPLAGRDDWR